MDNNDILIRLRYALDIKNTDMVEIFKLGGIEVTKEKALKILTKAKTGYHNEYENSVDIDKREECNNFMLESFLNGLIVFKRGKQDPTSGQSQRPEVAIKGNEAVNNVLLKKLKIALGLTSEDMLDIFEKAEVNITKGELSAILRRVGHKNYHECGDKYARNFLKGLTIKYRNN